ncbi:MAG: hypothetical protein ACKVOB_09200 [Sphingomonas sp.]
MSVPSLNDPASLFREMVSQWEAMANEFGANVLKSGEFTRVMHGANAATLKMREASGDMMERALSAANMPSKAEVADLSARLSRIESAVDRIEALLVAQNGATTATASAPARPKPSRTRKPPAKVTG